MGFFSFFSFFLGGGGLNNVVSTVTIFKGNVLQFHLTAVAANYLKKVSILNSHFLFMNIVLTFIKKNTQNTFF